MALPKPLLKALEDEIKLRLRQQGSLIKLAWIKACDQHVKAYNSPKASYAGTGGLKEAFDLNATIATIRVSPAGDGFEVTGSVILSGSLVRDAHNRKQVPLTSAGAKRVQQDYPRVYPTQVGNIGSVWDKKRLSGTLGYLLPYLKGAEVAPGQWAFYRALSMDTRKLWGPGAKISRTNNPKDELIRDFAKTLGLTLKTMDTRKWEAATEPVTQVGPGGKGVLGMIVRQSIESVSARQGASL